MSARNHSAAAATKTTPAQTADGTEPKAAACSMSPEPARAATALSTLEGHASHPGTSSVILLTPGTLPAWPGRFPAGAGTGRPWGGCRGGRRPWRRANGAASWGSVGAS